MNYPSGIVGGGFSVPQAVGVIAFLTFIFSWGPNSLLGAFCLFVLVVGWGLLWRPGEPPVMLLLFGLQWLQASVKIIQANWKGVPLMALSQFQSDIVTASWLSLVGLLFLAAGMRLAVGPYRSWDGWTSRTSAMQVDPSRWFWLYIAAFIVSLLAAELATMFRGLSQPLLALAQLKWAFFFMLALSVLIRQRGGRALWLAALGLELSFSVGGYFSDFKTVFYVSILATVAGGVRIGWLRGFTLAGLFAALLSMAITWTAVKSDYRYFVSAGQAAQVVERGYDERLTHLGELVAAIDGAKWQDATDAFLSRLAYVDFFGSVLDYVPTAAAHTRGDIWLDAVARPFTPRMLFPAKTAIEDSERTNMFTGLQVAGADRGASISIGYIGESYIDFGAIGMMFPVFAIGLLLGAVYRWLVITGSMRGLLGSGLAIPGLLGFAYMESSITKVLGGLVAMLLVLWLFGRIVAPRLPQWVLGRPWTPQLSAIQTWQQARTEPRPRP